MIIRSMNQEYYINCISNEFRRKSLDRVLRLLQYSGLVRTWYWNSSGSRRSTFDIQIIQARARPEGLSMEHWPIVFDLPFNRQRSYVEYSNQLFDTI